MSIILQSYRKIKIIEASLEFIGLIFRILNEREIILQRHAQERYHLLHSARHLKEWKYLSSNLPIPFEAQIQPVSYLYFLDPTGKVSPFICQTVASELTLVRFPSSKNEKQEPGSLLSLIHQKAFQRDLNSR